MKIFVKVKTGKREAGVEQIDETHFTVAVQARAEKGRANAEVVELLADYFHVPKSKISIVSGRTSRIKMIEI